MRKFFSYNNPRYLVTGEIDTDSREEAFAKLEPGALLWDVPPRLAPDLKPTGVRKRNRVLWRMAESIGGSARVVRRKNPRTGKSRLVVECDVADPYRARGRTPPGEQPKHCFVLLHQR